MRCAAAAVVALCLGFVPTASTSDDPQQLTPHQIVRYFNSSLIVVEAENFTSKSTGVRGSAGPGGCRGGSPWSPCVWGADDNLFASDVSNVFHSRVGYLHADAE